QTEVLLDAERVDRRQILEGDVVPGVGLAHVVSDAELAPAPVDVDEMAKGLERAVVIEHAGPTQLFVGQLTRCRQDLVVRPGMEPNEREEGFGVHRHATTCSTGVPEARVRDTVQTSFATRERARSTLRSSAPSCTW